MPNSAESQEIRNEGSKRGQQLPNFIEHHWRTPNTLEKGEGQVQLCHQAKEWPTPRASEAGPDFAKADRSDTGMALPAVAEQWASPRASDGAKGSPNQAFGEGGGVPLAAQTIQWGPPVAVVRVRDESTMAKGLETRKASGRTTVPLYIGEQAERWGTPMASERAQSPRDVDHGIQLANQTEKWETPSVALTDGTRASRSGDRSDELLLTGQALASRDHWTTPTRDVAERETPYAQGGTPLQLQASRSQRQDQTTPDGAMYSKARRFVLRLYRTLSSPRIPSWSRLRAWVVRSQRRKLSEWFVEWLHGWPTGWTDSETAVTEFQVWLRRSRGQLLRLLSTPVDRGLF
jgi:hypothetical protein